MKLGVITFARLSSIRVPRKMIEPLGGRPLLEIHLEKLAIASRNKCCEAAICMWPGQKELVDIVNATGVDIIAMPESSVHGETLTEIYAPSFCKNVQERFDVIVITNACCPFVTVADIESWIDIGQNASCSMMPVYERRDFLYNSTFERISGAIALNTKTNPVFYHSCHVFRIVFSNDFGNERYCTGKPFVVPRHVRWQIDIDTPEDVELARAAWDGGYGR